jgi:hypothetical protein
MSTSSAQELLSGRMTQPTTADIAWPKDGLCSYFDDQKNIKQLRILERCHTRSDSCVMRVLLLSEAGTPEARLEVYDFRFISKDMRPHEKLRRID